MVDTQEAALSEIKQELSNVSAGLHLLAIEQAETRVELREVKDRVLKENSDTSDDYKALRAELTATQRSLNATASDVEALKSRQAPMATPAAWGALLVSGILAVRSFLGV